MRTDYPVELLKRMLETYSPSGQEEKLALFLKEQLTRSGFKNVRLDGAGNVFGEVGRGSLTILLCGHMDTVPGNLPMKVEGDKIYGRGAVDAKSSLASMILASSKLRNEEKLGRTVVACVVDEEGKGKGIRQILSDELNVDYAIFGEPSGVRNITVGYKGRFLAKILCKTEPGHVGAQHTLKNAIEEAYAVWNKIRELSLQSRDSTRNVFNSMTVCLTGIQGGDGINVVPASCRLTIDVRLPPKINCARGVQLLKEAVRQHEKENPGVEFEVTIEDEVEPFVTETENPVIWALKGAIRETVGGPVKLLRKTGTGDMNVFAARVKVPVATYGPGDSRLSHTLNEYVELSEYLASIEVYRRTIANILGSHSPPA